MTYPYPMINRWLTCIIFFVIASHNAFSQDCNVFNTGRKSYYFSDTSMSSRKYESIRNDSVCFNALLITKDGLSGKTEIVKLTMDESGNMAAEFLSRDSLLFTDKRKASKAVLEAAFKENKLSGFYEGTCNNGSSHLMQILIISNPYEKKWIELTSFDGRMRDILKGDKEFEYLFNLYKILSAIKKAPIRGT